MVLGALQDELKELRIRRANAQRLAMLAEGCLGVRTVRSLLGAEPSYLRFPILSTRRDRESSRRIGASRAYPRLLDEEPHFSKIVTRGVERLQGANELREGLFTLPCHSMLVDYDFEAIGNWMRELA
jgi:dTDP-4-amino-4,6-dideoxygalactose transaminase